MAAATITTGAFGFKSTGGTDATTLTTVKVTCNKLIVTSGSSAGGSVVITDGAAVPIGTFASATASRTVVYDLNDVKLDGVIGTLSHTDVIAVLSVK